MQDKEYFEMCKDTEKEDELKSMQAAWETQQPGRLEKVGVHTDTSTLAHTGNAEQTAVRVSDE